MHAPDSANSVNATSEASVAAPRGPARLRVLLTLMCVALGLVVGANSALAIAQPDIAVDLGATQTELGWIVNVYALVFAALLLPVGIAADKYGRRGFLVAGLLVFGAASAASGLVDQTLLVILLRGLAGAGAAAVMPATLSVLVDAFPAERRAYAVSIWAGVSGAGAVLGLFAAGGMLEFFWWGSIQLVFGAAAGVTALLAALIVAPSRQPGLRVDVAGAILVFLGLLALVAGVTIAGEDGWDAPLALALLAGGLAGLTGFVLHELRSSSPMLDVRLFRSPGLAAGSIIVTLQSIAAAGLFFLIPQYFQLVLGYTPLETAIRILPLSVGIAPAAQFGPRLLQRFGVKGTAAWGVFQMAAGFVLLAATSGQPYWQTAIAIVVLGFGFGLALTPATVLIMAGLPADRRTLSAAVNDVTREVGAAVGGALAASTIVAVYAGDLRERINDIPAAEQLPEEVRDTATEGLAQALALAPALPPEAGAALDDAAIAAFTLGFQTHLLLGAAILVVGGIIGIVLAPRNAEISDT